ncbi:hypothetical protein [uncultured Lamprocystis sp.]|jgi:hypothetical protein|uniref:phage tail terminator protein n=1 Tax=uncultured Lamprocystis sp. TaxID=543132 RepID=UPI0025FD6369|nr:hypothetical protein [uncultured Lamprocystis sp.]
MDRANYLALEPLLLERLEPLTTDWPTLRIEAARDVAGVLAKDQRLPSLCVLYQGDAAVDATDGLGQLVHADQRWAVVVAARDLREAAAGRVSAGELAAAVIARLQGWQPNGRESGLGRLRRQAAPAPVYSNEGAVYLPLTFTCRVLSRGALGDL